MDETVSYAILRFPETDTPSAGYEGCSGGVWEENRVSQSACFVPGLCQAPLYTLYLILATGQGNRPLMGPVSLFQEPVSRARLHRRLNGIQSGTHFH